MTKHDRIATARRSSYGFSIIELVVVIVIIGILTSMAAVAYSQTQKQARDTKRSSDIAIFQSELEKFYDEHGEYPPGCSLSACSHVLLTANQATSIDFTPATTVASIRTVLPGIPSDFGDPRFASQPPIAAEASANKKYFYYGGTVNYSYGNTSHTQYTPAPTCGISSSLVNGQAGSYVVGYFSEESNKWVLKPGRNADQMTITYGSAADGCVINK